MTPEEIRSLDDITFDFVDDQIGIDDADYLIKYGGDFIEIIAGKMPKDEWNEMGMEFIDYLKTRGYVYELSLCSETMIGLQFIGKDIR